MEENSQRKRRKLNGEYFVKDFEELDDMSMTDLEIRKKELNEYLEEDEENLMIMNELDDVGRIIKRRENDIRLSDEDDDHSDDDDEDSIPFFDEEDEGKSELQKAFEQQKKDMEYARMLYSKDLKKSSQTSTSGVVDVVNPSFSFSFGNSEGIGQVMEDFQDSQYREFDDDDDLDLEVQLLSPVARNREKKEEEQIIEVEDEADAEAMFLGFEDFPKEVKKKKKKAKKKKKKKKKGRSSTEFQDIFRLTETKVHPDMLQKMDIVLSDSDSDVEMEDKPRKKKKKYVPPTSIDLSTSPMKAPPPVMNSNKVLPMEPAKSAYTGPKLDLDAILKSIPQKGRQRSNSVATMLQISEEVDGQDFGQGLYSQEARNNAMDLPAQQGYMPVIHAHAIAADENEEEEEGEAMTEQELENVGNELDHLCMGQSTEMCDTPRRMARAGIELHPHQKIFLHWAKGVEDEFGGGILADEMGIGKTVEMIALMLERPVDTTLVVAPTSVIHQWAQEVRKFSNGTLKVYIYHGSDRTKNVPTIESFDVVVTTYGTLSAEFPYPTKKDPRVWRPSVTGPLYRVKWDRIVLDEAHKIRNLGTKTHRAACDAKLGRRWRRLRPEERRRGHRHRGTLRWTLSGTPVQNKLLDLHALCKFLQFPELGHTPSFKRLERNCSNQYINSRDRKRAWKILRGKLRSVCMRRNKKMKIEGKPIVDLPLRRFWDKTVEFLTKDERQTYDTLFKRGQQKINRFLQDGTVMKNYMSVLVMLLRLRQVCSHPYLVCANVALDIKKIGKKIDERKLLDVENMSEEEKMDLTCPICQDVMIDEEEKVWTKCTRKPKKQHHFCRECIEKWVFQEGKNSCPVCRRRIDPSVLHEKNQTLAQRKLARVTLDSFEHSTKTKMLLEYLKNILSETDDKILVVSQWTSFLDICRFPLEKLFKKKKFRKKRVKFASLDGRLSIKDRQREIERARDSTVTRVLLVGMQSCGLGLNLNFANHVFLMDQWWNPAKEAQAIDRVYRIGQRKETHVYRFMIKDSVEGKILGIKKRKQEIANNAFGEKFRIGNNRLNLDDIVDIFDLRNYRAQNNEEEDDDAMDLDEF